MEHPAQNSIRPFALSGKVIIVTGAARGLGRQFSDSFAAAGANVVACDVDGAAVEEFAGSVSHATGNIIGALCDVTNEDDVRALMALAEKHFGRIDGVVNNAGITYQESAVQADLNRWIEVVRINLIGTYCVSRQAARLMLMQGHGSIVNLASIHALVAPSFHNASAYCASKAGVVGLTRALAKEWGEAGLRVNAIAPGFIETDMTKAKLSDETYRSGILSRTPMQRIGKPADLIGAVQFLLSDASAFVTGQVLGIDGGWTTI
ncbi:MAG: SDR family NAD(P)-dependent oxidoreductase [Hyphomicrobiales bacterium]